MSGKQLKNAPKNLQVKRDNNEVIVQQSMVYSGPIPAPSVLAEYEHILNGSADRIIAMAEKEQNERINLSKAQQKTDSRDSLLGIISALLICLFFGVM